MIEPIPISTVNGRNVDARPYFEGLSLGELRLQYCRACRRYQFPPRALCIHCGQTDMDWKRSSAMGRIYAMTTCHRTASAFLAAEVPYVVALVDLDEGVRILARVLPDEMGCPEIGSRIVVRIHQAADGQSVLTVRPSREGTGASKEGTGGG